MPRERTRVPTPLVRGERVAPLEPVQHADDRVAAPSDDRDGSARAAARATSRRWRRAGPSPKLHRDGAGAWSPNRVPAAARRPPEATHSNRTPSRSSRRAKRRADGRSSGRLAGLVGAVSASRGQVVARPCGRRPVGPPPALRRRASHQQRRAADRDSESHSATASPRSRRHQPGAVVTRRPARCPSWRTPGPRAEARAVQPLAAAAQRDDRVEAAGRIARHAATRVRGRAASVSHHDSTQSGVWKYELPSCRSASSSHSRLSASVPSELREVDDLRPLTMPAACAAPRSPSPTVEASVP